MTRSWNFTLPLAGTWYNLWDDLISQESGFDPTFSNYPYVPSTVEELQIQSPWLINAGKVVYIAYDSNKSYGTELAAGSADLRQNGVNLKSVYVSSDGTNAQVNVCIS